MGLSFVSEPVRVRVPATSANLGPGFDSLGLALALHDQVSARVTAGGCQVTVTGAGAGELPDDDTHLVVRAMRATFDLLGGQPRGLALDCVNGIPQARGLGSSSAAIVAGVELARALVADGADRLDDAGALRLAAEIEGHPDNVAPCLLGGFTIAWTETTAPAVAGMAGVASVNAVAAEAADAADAAVTNPADGARAVTLRPSAAVTPVLFVPEERGLTAVARAALPATVPHHDAARNAGRAALLVHALTVDPSLLFPATEDRLHQDYRATGMPGTAALVTALREAGVAAVVSGAGPTVLALSTVPEEFDPGIGWSVRLLPVDVTGALVDRVRLGHAERDPVAAGRKS
ncbi:homoserine kinase [Micromonospora pisi]|uniref:Homoserine kinase n=1 Tax=Micromonospora pisi TaxID=589240 RepID=A0A495JGR6_9ACTN|nr:homoserine kinase [Micromonospora pisi]RKR88097.1 homoserine kinase [Micromonospora pisi]